MLNCARLRSILEAQYNNTLLEILVTNQKIQTKLSIKQDAAKREAKSSFSLFMLNMVSLFKVLLIPVDDIPCFNFKVVMC